MFKRCVGRMGSSKRVVTAAAWIVRRKWIVPASLFFATTKKESLTADGLVKIDGHAVEKRIRSS
jgi:hypothetical protein